MVIAGLSLGWESLVVWGIAPLLISVLPCLIMCAVGLCMMKCKDNKEEGKPGNGVQGSVAPAMTGNGSHRHAWRASVKRAAAYTPRGADILKRGLNA